MTAEIAIMNREAVALAADSAITLGGESRQKVFVSGNKLFALSKYHPVAVMVYGNATFMEVPWETVIKIYRSRLGTKSFNRLEKYAEQFIGFLDSRNPLFPNSAQLRNVRESVYSYFHLIREEFTEAVRSQIDQRGAVSEQEIQRVAGETIRKHYDMWNKAETIPSIPKAHMSSVLRRYRRAIDDAIEEVFQKVPLPTGTKARLRRIAASLFSKFPQGLEKETVSGLVIAGFGERDTFPSLCSYVVEGISGDRLKYRRDRVARIGDETEASIIPFAQQEMVATFMEGIDPFYRETEESYLGEIFNSYARIVADSLTKYTDQEREGVTRTLLGIGKQIVEEHRTKLRGVREQGYINPITTVVSMLPKDELAAMAESLVNLTSFKKRVTMESETVGGPIDVAVISKGDGLIWMKRKHYFTRELNPQFFANYYREASDEQ